MEDTGVPVDFLSGPCSCSSRNGSRHTQSVVVTSYIKLYACFHMQSFFSSWRKGGSKRRPGPRKALGSQVLVLSDAKSRGKEEKLENINLESNDQILKETEGLVRADKMCETAGLQSGLQVV